MDSLAKEFADVSVDYCHVDAASMFFVTQPERFDVVVTDNLFGDILTDLGAAVAGGIGLAASGNINPDGAAPSMFEPVHGSAPDIAGRAKADPTAAILSAALLCDAPGPDGRGGQDRAGRRGGPGRAAGRLGTPEHAGDRRRHRRASSRLGRAHAPPGGRALAPAPCSSTTPGTAHVESSSWSVSAYGLPCSAA